MQHDVSIYYQYTNMLHIYSYIHIHVYIYYVYVYIYTSPMMPDGAGRFCETSAKH